MDPTGAARPPGDPARTDCPVDRATRAETISRALWRLMHVSMLYGFSCLSRSREQTRTVHDEEGQTWMRVEV